MHEALSNPRPRQAWDLFVGQRRSSDSRRSYQQVSWMRIARSLVFLLHMLKGKVIQAHTDSVTIRFEDGQSLRLPISDVEGSPKEGMDISIVAAALGSEDAGRQKLAQHLLNQLLKA